MLNCFNLFHGYSKAFIEAQEDRRNHRPHKYGEDFVPTGPLWSEERGYAAGWEEG